MISEENVKMGNKALMDEVEHWRAPTARRACSGWWNR